MILYYLSSQLPPGKSSLINRYKTDMKEQIHTDSNTSLQFWQFLTAVHMLQTNSANILTTFRPT